VPIAAAHISAAIRPAQQWLIDAPTCQVHIYHIQGHNTSTSLCNDKNVVQEHILSDQWCLSLPVGI
jgi:hypothetical protein